MAATTFEAVIEPHRSLGRSGTRLVAGSLIVLSAAISTILYRLGAWPVIGFSGAELTLALVLLRHNGSARRASERLLLSPEGLTIVRTGPGGRRCEQLIEASWLRATLQEDPGRTPVLWLVDRARRYEVAASLGELEKRDLANALQAALYRLRNPSFDNPQLRPL